ncbi:type II toxin-antitoxin system VapB family antitoxin [Mycolicibacterium pallens]|uniref:Type II toxin-antitoxin system VapB family antitoxin n=1 Tax=Mycolicibacterium pallens TaxID=370524 RepID=A0ABX8VJ38_9MYCO|nr:type II toxin-antitoxin system VapB family antitoxin [Mycolicibacterium pallens]QYL17800.1 type II toxin-antitoxin system VapB family antitoxin [Mycolicibacterium pallens]
MSLNIKNPQTVALVRELARRTGLSQTSAVEEAVRAKLAQLTADEGGDTRRQKVNDLLAELDRSITAQQRKSIRKDETDLYDENGLPA